jgi:capsule polysaccharide export protein KpsE/RkpR
MTGHNRTAPYNEAAAYAKAYAQDDQINGESSKLVKQLSKQLTATEALIAQVMWLPDTHPMKSGLSAFLAQRDSLKYQIDTELATHAADVTTRSTGTLAYAQQRADLERQIAAAQHKLDETGWLPARHPALATRPALEAQIAALQAQLDGLVDPGYDFS